MSTWHAIRAGGEPRKVLARTTRGTMIAYVPVFHSHDDCNAFWADYIRRYQEDTVWGVTDTLPKGWGERA